MADSFDLEETLPYMLGDDSDLLEDDNQFDILPFNSQVPSDITVERFSYQRGSESKF